MHLLLNGAVLAPGAYGRYLARRERGSEASELQVAYASSAHCLERHPWVAWELHTGAYFSDPSLIEVPHQKGRAGPRLAGPLSKQRPSQCSATQTAPHSTAHSLAALRLVSQLALDASTDTAGFKEAFSILRH